MYKKLFIFMLAFSLMTNYAVAKDSYNDFKEKLHNDYGFDYLMRAGLLFQHGAPNGKHTAARQKYQIEGNWDIFENQNIGSGSLQFFYEDIIYSKYDAIKIARNIGVASPLNEDPKNVEYFKRFVYTHRLPGKLDKLSLSVGQFLIGQFYKANYHMRDINHFNNLSFFKNITQGHPISDFGTYATYDFLPNLSVIVGAQNQTRYNGHAFTPTMYDNDEWTKFLYLSYSPHITDYGRTNISGYVYHSPKVENKGYNETADGYMIIATQHLGKFATSIKVNSSSGERMLFERSYNLMLMYNDPLNRNEMDQIGLGFVHNRLTKKYNRKIERLMEAYWSFGISDKMTITPDIEWYYDPAFDKNKNAFVSGITFKVYF